MKYSGSYFDATTKLWQSICKMLSQICYFCIDCGYFFLIVFVTSISNKEIYEMHTGFVVETCWKEATWKNKS